MRASSAWLILCGALLLAACNSVPKSTPQRAATAKLLFDKATKEFHLPSADAVGPLKAELLAAAASQYQQLQRDYPEQEIWCAQAQRSLANVRAEQGDLEAALKLYADIQRRYPNQEWEILQSWKSASDLLWQAERQEEARDHYRRIIERFDQPERPQVYKIIVQAAKKRLAK